MSFLPTFDISASALSAQRLRMDISSSNLANTQTTQGPDGKPYQKLMPVFRAAPVEFESELGGQQGLTLSKVEISEIKKSNAAPKRIYDPGHPNADKDGYVMMPNINLMEEMADLLMSSRSYEANVTAFNTTKAMAIKTLDLGKI